MPEVSEKLRDISAASKTRLRRLHLHQEAYLKNRELLSKKLLIIYPHLNSDYRNELRVLAERDLDMLKELGEIMILIGKDTLDFIEEAKQCLKS